jgi:hypothetical protein
MKISKKILVWIKNKFNFLKKHFQNIISNTKVKDNTKNEKGHRGFFYLKKKASQGSLEAVGCKGKGNQRVLSFSLENLSLKPNQIGILMSD